MISLASFRGLFTPPRITTMRHAHDGVAVAGGRTALRVVVEGSGLLRIGAERRWVSVGLDAVFFVDVHRTIEVHFTTLRGSTHKSLALKVVHPSPGRPHLHHPERPAMPSAPSTTELPAPNAARFTASAEVLMPRVTPSAPLLPLGDGALKPALVPLRPHICVHGDERP